MKRKQLRNKKGQTEAEFLAAYEPGDYERPSVTVDMLIFTVEEAKTENYRKLPEKKLSILLIQRDDHPYISQWALPGGFVNSDESLEEAARRELKEETDIEPVYMEQLYTWGELGRDPRTWIISCSYLSLIDHRQAEVKCGDDAADARWFSVSSKQIKEQKKRTRKGLSHEQWHRLELASGDIVISGTVKTTRTLEGRMMRLKHELVESDNIAFDHAKIILAGVDQLRRKVEDTDIAFNLMGELFTLTELQQAHEVILDRKLIKANFRRKIAGRVQETDAIRKDAGHRPSKLFRFKEDEIPTMT